MALTVTTDLTVITTAETLTGWSSYGSGGAGAAALEPDFFVQGANCISRGVSGAVNKGMCFDIGSGSTIDFTTGTHKDKLVYVWMRTSTPGLCDTRANGGLRIVLGSGATAPGDAAGVWSAWYMDGSDSIVASDGWICYVIDPQSTASTTFGGGVNKAAVRWFGGVQRSTATAKGQNFGVDQISYGRGEIRVSGTVATTGAGFKEITDVVYDSAGTNRWGVITVKAGVFYVRGKIILGHASSNTTFSSQGETVVWETPSYYNGTNVVKAIPDASSGGTTGSDGKTTYNGLGIIGGSGTTTIDFGVIVGTDAGRSGSSLVCAKNNGLTTPGRTLATVTVDSSTMALSLYATTFAGFEGQIDLTGTGVSADDCYGCTFDGCGRIDSNMEIRNVNVLNSVTGTTDGAFIWSSTTDLQKGVFANNSRAIVFESATGSPFTFTSLTFSGNTKDVRNESGGAITINVVNGTTPTTEDSGGGSSTTIVVNPVDTTITVKDIDTGSAISSARVLVTASDNTGTMPFEKTTTITRSGATATATCTGHGLVDGKKAVIKGADQQEYNGVFAITFVDANTFTFTVSGSPATPATGTIKTTGVVIDGTTNGSGVITDTRSHAADQPITGRVRKATSGTLYKTGSISGVVDNGTGFAVTVQLIPDA